jgi:hypothetical protein
MEDKERGRKKAQLWSLSVPVLGQDHSEYKTLSSDLNNRNW